MGVMQRSPLGVFSGSFYMPWVFSSFASAYMGAGGITNWDTDYARWENIRDNADPSFSFDDSFWGEKRRYYKVTGGFQNSPAGGALEPFFDDPLPYYYSDLADSKINYRVIAINGFGGAADPTFDELQELYCYRRYITFTRVDPRPLHVSFFIQDDANCEKADFDPGLSALQSWFDDVNISWDETEDADCRWLKWMCDYYDERY